eukprot:CAMPEP_0196681512 /NCGR_PEP_ID=MMETSP1090-20130531/8562_1 /TAXON_ID=37098 /ORGANISM="Isochrysis sp, Strain CCMP1244" /LENGTH=161 /DNA_ID=CAMNT_0042019879 /DNA_START=80 /DNA_END=563 /DNA_ORIENTATION=-
MPSETVVTRPLTRPTTPDEETYTAMDEQLYYSAGGGLTPDARLSLRPTVREALISCRGAQAHTHMARAAWIPQGPSLDPPSPCIAATPPPPRERGRAWGGTRSSQLAKRSASGSSPSGRTRGAASSSGRPTRRQRIPPRAVAARGAAASVRRAAAPPRTRA